MFKIWSFATAVCNTLLRVKVLTVCSIGQE